MHNSREIVEKSWAAMQTNDFSAASNYPHDEYILEWRQSGERIRGRADVVAVNQNYPAHGRWQCSLHRVNADGDEVVSDVSVTDGTVTARAITFSHVRDGRILCRTEFWPEPFAPAAWREAWVERM